MSLVVARLLSSGPVIVSDSWITERMNPDRAPRLEGVIKTQMITDTLCVSFAGNLHWAEVAMQQIEHAALLRPPTLPSVAEILRAIHIESIQQPGGDTEFLLACADPERTLIQIKDGQERVVQAAWLGSSRAFERFQGVMTGEITPIQRPTNTVAFEMFRVPELARGGYAAPDPACGRCRVGNCRLAFGRLTRGSH